MLIYATLAHCIQNGGPRKHASEFWFFAESEDARFATAEDKAARKKRYYAERDATKINLLNQHTRWRELMNELELKSDKELAAVLLDNYMSRKNQHFR